MIRFFLLLWVMMPIWMSTSPAHAADYTYSPKGCDFKMTFPEEPGIGQSCDPDNPQLCHQVRVYNKFFALNSGLRITASCGKAEPGMLNKYSGKIMEYTLSAMAKNYVDAKTAKVAFTDLGTAKEAVLMGGKKESDGTESVYMAVMMIGAHSVLSTQGEVTGVDNPEADKLFAHIMKSVAQVTPADAKSDNKNNTETGKDTTPPAAPQDKKH